MRRGLSFVNATGSGCVIYRETSGRYVVSHVEEPLHSRPAATLAGAYAVCQGWERSLIGEGAVATPVA
jgi:hypothetical protein